MRPVIQLYLDFLPLMLRRGTQIGAITGGLYGGFISGKKKANFPDTFGNIFIFGVFGAATGFSTPLLIPPVTIASYYIGKHYTK